MLPGKFISTRQDPDRSRDAVPIAGTVCPIALLLLASLGSTLAAQESPKDRPNLQGEILNVRAEPRDVGDPEVLSVALTFQMKVHNPSTIPALLGTANYDVCVVQFRKRGTTKWTQFTIATLIYQELPDLTPCAALPPGSVLNLEKVNSGILNLKKLWPDLSEVEFRLHLQAMCRMPESGQARVESVVTRPFQFELKQ